MMHRTGHGNLGRNFSVRTAAAVMMGLWPLLSYAQTATVSTLEDVVDFGGAQQMGDLPGPDGKTSFREALYAANNTVGPQTIKFAIPRSEWWLVSTMAVLKLEIAAFVVRDAETTIDFLSQREFTGDTNPGGNEVGIYGLQPNGWGSPAIIIEADRCVIHGLGDVWQRGSSVAVWRGSDNRITGCVTGAVELSGSSGGPPVTGAIIGGTTQEEGNRLDEVSISCWSNDNIVIGNTLREVVVVGSRYCVYPAATASAGQPRKNATLFAASATTAKKAIPRAQESALSGLRTPW